MKCYKEEEEKKIVGQGRGIKEFKKGFANRWPFEQKPEGGMKWNFWWPGEKELLIKYIASVENQDAMSSCEKYLRNNHE